MIKKRKWLVIGIFVALLLSLIWNLENYLTITTKTNATSAIIEGWQNANYLEKICELIKRNKRLAEEIIIVGWQYQPDQRKTIPIHEALPKNQLGNNEIHLFANSSIEFDIPPNIRATKNQSAQIIDITLKGSFARNIATHYTLFINGEKLLSGFCTDTVVHIKKEVQLSGKSSLIITFDNDIKHANGDRNLSILGCSINNYNLFNDPANIYYFDDHPHQYKGLFPSNSAFAKNYLEDLGIPPSNIKVVEAPHDNFNKTNSLAKKFGEWYRINKASAPRSFNIITSSIHGRRSLVAFSRQVPDYVKLGVVSIPPDDPFNNSISDIIKLIDEFLSLVYTWLFFHGVE
ncbi:MAG: hypothetical protein GVY19_00440 [Bacteroidetes bacterium]|jgi:hypothetical protein|nr:hypothetical protein [Bacteroidota bacterium]